jgi:hypothetical protein
MAEHDLTKPSWGHNYELIDWPNGKLFVWLTPRPVVGDILLIPGKKSVIRAEVVKVKWMSNVDDMYKVWVQPEGYTGPPKLDYDKEN